MASEESPKPSVPAVTLEENAAMLKLAASVAHRAQIEDLRLIKMSCAQNLRPGPLPPHVNIEMNAEHSLNEQESKITVDVGYKLAATYKQGEPVTGESLWATVTFRVTYSLTSFEGLTEPEFKAFAYMNGIYNTWPFWRESLHSMLSRMSLPPLTIPVYSPGTLAKSYVEKVRRSIDELQDKI